MLADPEDYEALMLYGFAHFATGDYLVASLAVRRAMNGDPTLIDHPIDLAAMYGDASALHEHIKLLDDYILATADDADALFLAGSVRYAAGQAGDATDFFTRLLKIDANDVLSMIMRDATVRAQVLERAAQSQSQSSMAQPPMAQPPMAQPPIMQPPAGEPSAPQSTQSQPSVAQPTESQPSVEVIPFSPATSPDDTMQPQGST